MWMCIALFLLYNANYYSKEITSGKIWLNFQNKTKEKIQKYRALQGWKIQLVFVFLKYMKIKMSFWTFIKASDYDSAKERYLNLRQLWVWVLSFTQVYCIKSSSSCFYYSDLGRNGHIEENLKSNLGTIFIKEHCDLSLTYWYWSEANRPGA